MEPATSVLRVQRSHQRNSPHAVVIVWLVIFITIIYIITTINYSYQHRHHRHQFNHCHYHCRPLKCFHDRHSDHNHRRVNIITAIVHIIVIFAHGGV